jgi:hypothetical protein
MRSDHAHSRPIQIRKEIRNESSNIDELSSLSLFSRTNHPGSLSLQSGVLFSTALPLQIALQNGKSICPDPSIIHELVEHGYLVMFSQSEVAVIRRQALQLPQREIAERRERRNLLQLEREHSLWDKLASIPRLLSTSALPPGFEEKLAYLRREIADTRTKHEATLSSLVEAQAAKRLMSSLVPCGLHHFGITSLGTLALQGDILRQLEEPHLTIQISARRIQAIIETCKALHERHQEIGSALLSKSECKKVWHLGDIQLGLTIAHGSVQEVVERFTDIFLRLKRDIEGTDRSIALASLGLSFKSGEREAQIALLREYAEALFPDRDWPPSSFFLTQATQFFLQEIHDDSLFLRYSNLSKAISHAKWGSRHRLVGQFASLLTANIEGNPELIVNQLTDLAESLEDIAGFRSELELEVASLLVLVEEGSIYRTLQRTVEARGLLGEPPYYNYGSTLVNSVLLAMLPGSIQENVTYLEEFSEIGLSTSTFRADCFLLSAAYAALERVDQAFLPAAVSRGPTPPSVIQTMCGSLLVADIVG